MYMLNMQDPGQSWLRAATYALLISVLANGHIK
jgi:hypothetical protein